MATKSIVTIDSDSHVFEPLTIWKEWLEPEYRVPARFVFSYHQNDDGVLSVILNGRPAPPMNRSRLNRQAIWRPGMTPDQIGALDPNGSVAINPGAYDPASRLKDMDAMGVDCTVLFPTLFAEYFPVIENPDLAYALSRAYNNWIHDLCAKAPDRLVPAAVLPLQDVAFAIEELRRVNALGFKACFLRPSFFQGRFLNHPYYDPLWKELETLGLAGCIHPSTGNTNSQWTSEGSFMERIAANLRIGHSIAESVAHFMDNATALTAFAFCGHMESFPRLKLVFAHGGASWLLLALEKAETYLTFFMIQNVCLEPEKVFFYNPYLVTFNPWERSITRLYDIVENVGAWGSRYPNHDAVGPAEVQDQLQRAKVPSEVISKFMGANAARIFGI